MNISGHSKEGSYECHVVNQVHIYEYDYINMSILYTWQQEVSLFSNM